MNTNKLTLILFIYFVASIDADNGLTIEELNKKLDSKLHEINVKLKALESAEHNSVPIGFIYAQLSAQLEPKDIWKIGEWKDVSDEYAGLFFRVYGGNSTQFGFIQECDSPRLAYVHNDYGYDPGTPKKIPSDGTFSQRIYSGSDGGNARCLTFALSKTEVRPRNIPMKIWKRIK